MTISVLKLGGGAGIDQATVVHNLAGRIRAGETWILVHGASAAADALAAQLGYSVQTITGPNGHTSRYSDARMIEIYSAAAASVNQQLCARLMQLGVRSVGLAGPGVILAQRKQAIRAIRDGRQVIIRDDYSGRITGVDSDLLRALLEAGYTPVIAPLALGEEGECLNVDGDRVAATVARTVNADALLILSNVPGLLRDINNPNSLITEFTLQELGRYESYAIGRMKTKLSAVQEANIARVILADSRLNSPIDAAFAGAGTHIVQERDYAEYTA
jgi:acetylglutamate/LysW-gamma-L-alpha-aminoadipate kinase